MTDLTEKLGRKRIEMVAEQWAKIRLKALERDNNKCSYCGSKENLVVHHIHYPGRELSDAVVLCSRCHRREHTKSRTDFSKLGNLMISLKIPFREKWLLTALERDSKKFDMSRSRLIIKILKAHYFMENHT